jgi:heme oxygenase (biliverdin-IX-beta and delta-forming)
MSDSKMIRTLIRKKDRAALASLMTEELAPYASMVMTATDQAGNILLLLSDLAIHSQNAAKNDTVSLLFEDEFGGEDPLMSLRVSVQATLVKTEDSYDKERYLARHPSAAEFADFGDFHFYKAQVNRLHFVAGFGHIDWLENADYLLPEKICANICEIESDIVQHMNTEHADSIELIAKALLGKQSGGWYMTGIDTEGCDFRLGVDTARLSFENLVKNAADSRKELVEATAKARAIS